MKNLLPALLTSALFLSNVCTEAGEPRGVEGAPSVSDQVRGSIGRLKSFGDESVLKRFSPDPRREEEIKRLMPNFRLLQKGTSSREARDQAIGRLSRVRLTKSGRQTANKVVDELSLFRHSPEVRFEVNPETYHYFLQHPDVVVSLWNAMGISAMKLQQTSPHSYTLDNNDGTLSEMYFIRKSKTSNIIFCKGEFKSPVLKKPISAQGILCLNSKFEKQKDGTVFVRHSADVFITFPSLAIETAAKMIAPVSNYIADRNFQEISLFMHSISLTMERQPGWLQQMADRMQGVHPDRPHELRKIILDNYQERQKRLAAKWDMQDIPAM